jgi:uncharacterized protein involved in exopolysaccharide biosynthesis
MSMPAIPPWARPVLIAGIAGAAVGLLFALLTPRAFEVQSSFMPQARRTPNLSALASQFGVNLAQDNTPGPPFYVDLLSSRTVLSGVLYARYADSTGSQVQLRDVLDAKGRDSAARHDDALKRLRKRITTSVSTKTGVVQMKVRMPDARLATDVSARLLDELNRFNLETRRSQASQERIFTEGRLQVRQKDLREAEGAMASFLKSNRNYANSPDLVFEHERLLRQVEQLRAVVITLVQAVEQSGIEEVRDTPVITILDRPEYPSRLASRGLIRYSGLGLLAGLVLGTFWSLRGNLRAAME